MRLRIGTEEPIVFSAAFGVADQDDSERPLPGGVVPEGHRGFVEDGEVLAVQMDRGRLPSSGFVRPLLGTRQSWALDAGPAVLPRLTRWRQRIQGGIQGVTIQSRRVDEFPRGEQLMNGNILLADWSCSPRH